MDLRTRKAALRRSVVDRIRAMDPLDRRDQEATLGRRLADLPGLEQARTVLLYASAFAEEIDTRPLLDQTLRSGRRLILPRVERLERSLRLFEVTDLDRDLQPGALGIPEPARSCLEVDPAEIDWVLVPGLAFDLRGYRLGRGAGLYDRLLPRLRPDAPRWALILEPQWVDSDALPVEPHDQRLDGVADHQRLVVAL